MINVAGKFFLYVRRSTPVLSIILICVVLPPLSKYLSYLKNCIQKSHKNKYIWITHLIFIYSIKLLIF